MAARVSPCLAGPLVFIERVPERECGICESEVCLGDVLEVVDVLVQVLFAFDPDILVGCDVIS